MRLEPYSRVLHLDETGNSNGTSLDLYGRFKTAIVQVEGIGNGEVVFEGTVGNLDTFQEIEAHNLKTGATETTHSDDGVFRVPLLGFYWFRAKIQGKTDSSECSVIAILYSET